MPMPVPLATRLRYGSDRTARSSGTDTTFRLCTATPYMNSGWDILGSALGAKTRCSWKRFSRSCMQYNGRPGGIGRDRAGGWRSAANLQREGLLGVADGGRKRAVVDFTLTAATPKKRTWTPTGTATHQLRARWGTVMRLLFAGEATGNPFRWFFNHWVVLHAAGALVSQKPHDKYYYVFTSVGRHPRRHAIRWESSETR